MFPVMARVSSLSIPGGLLAAFSMMRNSENALLSLFIKDYPVCENLVLTIHFSKTSSPNVTPL